MTSASLVRSLHWQRLWLIALALVLAVAALALGASGSRRGWMLAVLVPTAFAPVAYARLRLFARGAAPLRGRPALIWTAAGLAVAADALMVAQLLTARAGDGVALLQASGVQWVGPVWFSTHALAALAYGARGLVRLAMRLLRWVTTAMRASGTPPDPAEGSLGRREVLQQLGMFGAAAPFAVSLSGVPLSYDFRVDEHEVELPHWPPALDGLRIAHLSDIHVGGAMDRARLQHVAALTAAARPDLIVHTGDFLTHRRGDFDAPLYEALATLRPRYGQFACFGNHDFDDPERLARRLRAAGVTVLRDALTTLAIDGRSLEIAGLDFGFDRAQRAADAARRIARWPARGAVPRLLLLHDPSEFALLPDGCADLVLSGHTHGGHIGVQLGPERAITVVGLAGIPDQGVFRRGDMRLFVTRCVGFYGYPMRVGIPPEIAIVTVRAPRPASQPV
ncbi:MAG TPA: metallophosphoesterase [Candidatus Dormibacteraeota bacterium]|nr:metallophosphoesterase [Candidatus Dormibacteraeota bacterium]